MATTYWLEIVKYPGGDFLNIKKNGYFTKAEQNILEKCGMVFHQDNIMTGEYSKELYEKVVKYFGDYVKMLNCEFIDQVNK